MLQCLAGSNPLSWIHRQHLIDKVLGFWRNGVPFWTWILHKMNIEIMLIIILRIMKITMLIVIYEDNEITMQIDEKSTESLVNEFNI